MKRPSVGKVRHYHACLIVTLLFLLLGSHIGAVATTLSVPPAKVIAGTVLALDGEPLAGATVIEKGTSNAIATDSEGRFTLTVAGSDAVLQVSYIGFQTQEITVGQQQNLKITLQSTTNDLREVVVTAYGKVNRASLTDAVSTIEGAKLENRPLRSIADGLAGLAPGLNITMPGGTPESNPTINIRGFTSFNASASPLTLIDGVERPIQDVNPNDVESISLLKDGASSAVYGSRAPYGVLLITTKSGKSGKMEVNYSANVKIGQMVMYPTQPNSPDWARYINIAQKNGQPNGSGVDGVDAITIQRMEAWLNKDWNNPAFDGIRTQFGENAQQYIENGQFPTTDIGFKNWTREQSFATTKWFETYLNKTEVSAQHNLSLSGGTDKIQYFSSLGFNNVNGLFKGDFNYNKRYNFKTKLNYKAASWLDLRTDVSYVRQLNQGANFRAGSANDVGSGATIANYGDIFNSMQQYFATPLKVPSGNAYSWILSAAGTMGDGGLIRNSRNETVLTGGATLRPLKYFEINGDYTWRSNVSEYSKTDKIAYTEFPDGSKVQNNRSANVNGITKTNGIQNYQYVNLNAQYQRSFADKHNVLVQLGMQSEENNYQSITGSKTDLFAQDAVESLRAAANNPDAIDYLYNWATLGYYGVATYDYEQKYLVKFTGRRDASSRFAPDARWGFFPSISGAWNVAKESFWPLKDAVSELKPRVSWSTSGDLTSIGASNYYNYLPTLNVNVNRTTLLGGNYAVTGYAPGLTSSSLTWAKPTVLDFGVDITALGNRLNIVYDWYQRTIVDQIGPTAPLPSVLGTSAPQQNNSESETRGWELSIGWNDRFEVASKSFQYGLRFNLSDYIGYVTKYNANTTGAATGTWTPGERFGQNFVYKSNGVAQNTADLNKGTLTGEYNYPGYLMYQDLNGDGYTNSGDGGFWYSRGDLVTNGYNYPRKSYSIIPTFSWNNISFSAVLEGVMQWKMYTPSELVWGTYAGNGGIAYFYTPAYQESTKLGYWSPGNESAFFPAFNTGRTLATDEYSINLAHLRIRNITLGYDLPKKLISRVGLKRANVYFSGENLGFILSKSFIKYDPQFLYNRLLSSSSTANSFPPLRFYSLGVNLTL